MFRKLLYSMVISLLCLSTVGFGQNVNDALRYAVPGIGAGVRALGMGNAYTAMSDDASGMFFNPAGLGLVKRMEFAGALEYQNFKNNTTFFGTETDYSNSTTKLNNLAFVLPFPTVQGSMVFGMAFNKVKNFNRAMEFEGFNNTNTSMIQTLNNGGSYIPFDIYLTDENFKTLINGQLSQSGNTIESGSINNWSFAGAVEVYKHLFIGMQLDIFAGEYESVRDYYEDDTRNNYAGEEIAPGYSFTDDFVTFYYNPILKQTLSGWDFKIGMLYQVSRFARVGAQIEFPKTYAIDETFTVDARADWDDGSSDFLPQTEDYSDKVSYDITTPYVFSLGSAFNVVGLIVSANIKLTDYTQTEFDNPDGLTEQYVESVNKDIKALLTSTIDYNIGLEYTLREFGVRFRAGFFTQASPYDGDPSDYDKKYFTGGLGFLLDNTIALDLVYAMGTWKTHGDNYSSGVSRTFQDITQHNFMLGFNYRF